MPSKARLPGCRFQRRRAESWPRWRFSTWYSPDPATMALFDQERPPRPAQGDAATRALSVTMVDASFVERVYQNIAKVYDYTYGPTLHPGRLEAIQKMAIRPGNKVLEVGVGTGINLALYPRSCRVTGIDLSSKMLEKAKERIASKNLRHCEVHEMDASAMSYADA